MASRLNMGRKAWTATAIAAGVLVIAAAVWHIMGGASKIPGEKKMARIMADIYTVDALLQFEASLGQGTHAAEKSYHTILEHYGLTKADYDSAVVWYSNHTDRYSAVYERTVAILSSREADFKKFAERRDSITRRIKFVNDSVRVSLGKWPKFVRLPLNESDTLARHAKPSREDIESLELDFGLGKRQGGILTYTSRYSFPLGRTAEDTIRTVLSVDYSDGSQDSAVNALSSVKTLSSNDITLHLDAAKTATTAHLRMACGKSLKESKMLMQDFALAYMPFIVPDSAANEIVQPPLFAY